MGGSAARKTGVRSWPCPARGTLADPPHSRRERLVILREHITTLGTHAVRMWRAAADHAAGSAIFGPQLTRVAGPRGRSSVQVYPRPGGRIRLTPAHGAPDHAVRGEFRRRPKTADGHLARVTGHAPERRMAGPGPRLR